jgi:hypothetical protein
MKTDTKHTHTQGPWKVYFYAKDSFGRIVATVGANDGCNRICEITPIALPENEVEANARLIAAAPDLLAGLKDLLFYHYHEIEMPAKGTRDREVYDAARAAIAKVEGNA